MPTGPKNIKFYENDFARVWIENKILCCEIKPNVVLNYHVARAAVYLRLRLQEEIYYAVYCDITGILESDEIARNYISNCGFTNVKAVSFLVTPYQYRNLQAYLDIRNIQVPCFITDNTEKAIENLAPYV